MATFLPFKSFPSVTKTASLPNDFLWVSALDSLMSLTVGGFLPIHRFEINSWFERRFE